MKKITISILVGTFCLGTTNTFAQTKQETPQEKIMRLEIENKVRQELMDSLSRKVATLEAELNKQQAVAQKEAVAKKNIATVLKPYYATLEIQQKCEQYPTCAKWVKETYNYWKSQHQPWQIKRVKEQQYFVEPGWFNRVGKTVYKMIFYTTISSSDFTAPEFIRVGLGKKPLSWEERVDAPYEGWYPCPSH